MGAVRLSEGTLPKLRADVRRPLRQRPKASIVHLGLGAFHRAHMAVYTEDAEAVSPGGWGIIGVTMRSPALRDALRTQDLLYSVIERSSSGDRARVVGILAGALTAQTEASAVIASIAAPTTRIVSLTVTEKAYALSAASHELRLDAPETAADLAAFRSGVGTLSTPIGLLVAGFEARLEAKLPGLTVMCCDNLPSNGDLLRRAVLRFAEARGGGIAEWIADHVAFPCSMVDRIVPAVTDADRHLARERLGLEDAAPVVTEPFTQWVIDDDFASDRPCWDQVGATIVADVSPYEMMKLRLLNGSHSSIAYLGQLAGWDTIGEAMTESTLVRHVTALMREVATTFAVPAEIDVVAYQRSLLNRFANSALPHRTAQIAMDGSQKLPQRLFPPALTRSQSGQSSPRIALAIAAWLHFLRGRSERGATLALDDPLAPRLKEVAAGVSSNADLVDRIFSMSDIVPAALAQSSFRGEVLTALDKLTVNGVRQTLAAMAS